MWPARWETASSIDRLAAAAEGCGGGSAWPGNAQWVAGEPGLVAAGRLMDGVAAARTDLTRPLTSGKV